MLKRILSIFLAAVLLSGLSAAAAADGGASDLRARDIVLNRESDTLGYRGEDSACYSIIDSSGSPLTDAVYTSVMQASGYPFFKVSVESEDGVHDEGLLDSQGNVIVPPEYADVEIVSDRWQIGVRLTPSEANDRGTFATVKNLDGTTIVLSAAAGELPEHYADTSFAGYDGSMAFTAENAAGEIGAVDLWGNVLVPFSADYRSVEVYRDGTVALIWFGDRQYRICRFSPSQPETEAPALVSPEEEAPDGAWTCPSCGTENAGKFCTECGAKKPEADGTWTCPSCGTENAGNFCMECGEKRPG